MISMNPSREAVKVGSPVWVRRKGQPIAQGVVAYMGPVDFAEGDDWVGVALTGSSMGQGKNDGSVAGKKYFQCLRPNSGLFIRRASVTVRAKAKTTTTKNPTNLRERRRSSGPTKPKSPVVKKRASTAFSPTVSSQQKRRQSMRSPPRTKQFAPRTGTGHISSPRRSFPLGLTINVATPKTEAPEESNSGSDKPSPPMPVFLFNGEANRDQKTEETIIQVPKLEEGEPRSLNFKLQKQTTDSDPKSREEADHRPQESSSADFTASANGPMRNSATTQKETNFGNTTGGLFIFGSLPPADDEDEQIEFDDRTGVSTIETATIHQMFDTRKKKQGTRYAVPSVLKLSSSKLSSSSRKHRRQSGSKVQKQSLAKERLKELERWRAGRRGNPNSVHPSPQAQLSRSDKNDESQQPVSPGQKSFTASETHQVVSKSPKSPPLVEDVAGSTLETVTPTSSKSKENGEADVMSPASPPLVEKVPLVPNSTSLLTVQEHSSAELRKDDSQKHQEKLESIANGNPEKKRTKEANPESPLTPSTSSSSAIISGEESSPVAHSSSLTTQQSSQINPEEKRECAQFEIKKDELQPNSATPGEERPKTTDYRSKTAFLLRMSRTRLLSASKKMERKKENALSAAKTFGTVPTCDSSPAFINSTATEGANASKRRAPQISAASCLNDLFWLLSILVLVSRIYRLATESAFLESLLGDATPPIGDRKKEYDENTPGATRGRGDPQRTKAAWKKLKGAFRSLSNRNSNDVTTKASGVPCSANGKSELHNGARKRATSPDSGSAENESQDETVPCLTLCSSQSSSLSPVVPQESSRDAP